jgi:hypothetical protein
MRSAVLAKCAAIGLTAEERHELAEVVTSHDSLNAMDRRQVRRLLDHLAGFELIVQLLAMRTQ